VRASYHYPSRLEDSYRDASACNRSSVIVRDVDPARLTPLGVSSRDVDILVPGSEWYSIYIYRIGRSLSSSCCTDSRGAPEQYCENCFPPSSDVVPIKLPAPHLDKICPICESANGYATKLGKWDYAMLN
jgi:hypothetical protein